MDEELKEARIKSEDLESLKTAISGGKPDMKWIVILLLVIAIAGIFICVNIIRGTNSGEEIDSTHRVLVVSIEKDIKDKKSDSTQVSNALANGGMMRLDTGDLKYSFGSSYSTYTNYAATDSTGSYWVYGAILNYVASRGWTLVQAPTTGATDEYYFIK